jgi:GTP1/Obg family GTP-binding protein
MTARAAVDMSESMELYRQSATTEIEKVKEMIISQMKAVVPRTRSLSQLSQAYKTLHECINGIKDGSIPENKSFMAIFNMQINAMKGKMEDETKDIDYEPTDD